MKFPRFSPLYVRLLVSFVAANILTLGVSMFITETLSRAAMARRTDWNTLALAAQRAYAREGAEGLQRWALSQRRYGIGYASLVTPDGNSLSGNPLPPPLQRRLKKLLADDESSMQTGGGQAGAVRIATPGGQAMHFVGMRSMRPPQYRLETLLGVQALLSLLAIGALGWWIVRGVARPVLDLRGVTRRMAGGDLSSRAADKWTRGRGELSDLARDFNHMAERLDTLVSTQRDVLRDISHELRSPLARLHLALELARGAEPAAAQKHIDRAGGEAEKLDELIGELLTLSRLEGSLPGMELQELRLSELVDDEIADSEPEREQRGISVSTALDASLHVRGDPALLRRAFGNLLGNAIKFSPSQGRIDITLLSVGDEAELSIRDHGPGAPEADLPHLFRPFFRSGNATQTEGYGLGLAIVSRVAQAHGGSATAINAEGGGLRVTLRLPTVSAAAPAAR